MIIKYFRCSNSNFTSTESVSRHWRQRYIFHLSNCTSNRPWQVLLSQTVKNSKEMSKKGKEKASCPSWDVDGFRWRIVTIKYSVYRRVWRARNTSLLKNGMHFLKFRVTFKEAIVGDSLPYSHSPSKYLKRSNRKQRRMRRCRLLASTASHVATTLVANTTAKPTTTQTGQPAKNNSKMNCTTGSVPKWIMPKTKIQSITEIN